MNSRGWLATAAGKPAELLDLDPALLDAQPVRIRISHSGLNYKDALALLARAPVVRRFPLVLGIDLAGTVERSADPHFRPGDRILATGWGLGEREHGGLATHAACAGDWLCPLPRGTDFAWAMALGTAGLTAWLAVERLRAAGIMPDRGPIAVTGASGGVGSFAIMLLGAFGYAVHAISGKPGLADQLRAIGASEILDRSLLSESKPLRSPRFAGAIDTIGGPPLASLLGLIQPLGAVVAVGNAAGLELPASLAPFILRGISLVGIDSVTVPSEQRERAWTGLAEALPWSRISSLVNELHLDEATAAATGMLAGDSRGRCLLRCTA